MAKASPKRGKNKDNARRSKKKISILNTEGVEYVDYKDVNLLRRFMSDRAKIRARRVTGNDAQQQQRVAMAIKNAREMALLPYANRVTQQRGGKRERPDRGERSTLAAADVQATPPTPPVPPQGGPPSAPPEAPTEDALTESAPTEDTPTEAAPTESAPTEAAPTEAAPTEGAATDVAAAEGEV